MKAKKMWAALLAACLMIPSMMPGTASADSVTVTTERLNVRARPDSGSSSIGVAREGDELSFVSETGSWIQVKFDGQIGFVSEEYVRLDNSEIAEDVKKNTVSDQGKGVTTERVNIRSLPMTGASVVTVAAKKATVTVTGVCGEWYQVECNGKTGYLMGDYLTIQNETVQSEATKAPVQSSSSYGDGVSGVVTYRVNMRADASTDSDVLRVLDEGDQIRIIGESGRWYWIYADGKEGYIVKTCAQIVEDGEIPQPTATVKPTAAPTATAAPEEEDDETLYGEAKTGTATERVNMRKSASTSAKIVRVIVKGQKVSVTGETGGWYKVSLNGTTGYVSKNYMSVSQQSESTPEPTVKPEATATPAPTVKPEESETYDEAKSGRTTARLNMRKSASTSASIVSVLPSGANVTVLGEQGSFYQVKYSGKTGYASKNYVTILSSAETAPEEDEKEEETVEETIYSDQKTGKTTARVNMRREPEGSVLHVLSADTKVTVLGERGSWYKVKYGSSTGYISKSYIREYDEDEEEDQTSGSGTTAYITGASVNMRKGPGTGYGVIKVLKVGAQIQYYSLKDGWYLIKSGSDTGYVSSKYVTTKKPEDSSSSSGSSGDSSSSGGSVILSDWFKGEIQSAFERGATVTITDVKTGLKFKATRTGGNYHADAQPATASDTKIMFKIYDSKWKWDRRAIWVTVDGKTYAASMNGMPHGETDTIPDNNFDGCFCIHFLNSKTHAGDRVDSAHQTCVMEAYNAGK